MRRARGLRVLPLLLALLAATASCTQAVAGVPSVAAPNAFPATVTAVPGSAAAAGPGGSARDPTPTAPPGPPLLEPDVLSDECLLDSARFAALLGRPVRTPAQSVVRRDDGSQRSSCYVGSADGDPAPLAAINVYRVRSGTPALFVRKGAERGRTLSGVGEAAAVLDTVAGPTLQVASARFVVTIAVQGREPGDVAWRAAARAALGALPP